MERSDLFAFGMRLASAAMVTALLSGCLDQSAPEGSASVASAAPTQKIETLGYRWRWTWSGRTTAGTTGTRGGTTGTTGGTTGTTGGTTGTGGATGTTGGTTGTTGGTTGTTGGTANTPPAISGAPITTVVAGSAYSFTPSASDANGNPLAFSVQNKPAWAAFNTATGQLSGTPTTANVGTYSNIVISVSDGKATTSLSAFAIAVTQPALGSASVSWSAPTQNADGSPLTDLAGYHIYYGTNANNLTQTINISSAGTTTYVVANLPSGTYYFEVKAYNSSGVESGTSNLASKTL
jgi:hypothetical protein